MYWQHESDNQYMTQLNTILLGPKSVHTMVYAAKRCHHSRHDAIDIDILYKLLTKYGYLIIHSVQFLYEIWSLYFIVALCDIFLGFNLIALFTLIILVTFLNALYTFMFCASIISGYTFFFTFIMPVIFSFHYDSLIAIFICFNVNALRWMPPNSADKELIRVMAWCRQAIKPGYSGITISVALLLMLWLLHRHGLRNINGHFSSNSIEQGFLLKCPLRDKNDMTNEKSVIFTYLLTKTARQWVVISFCAFCRCRIRFAISCVNQSILKKFTLSIAYWTLTS